MKRAQWRGYLEEHAGRLIWGVLAGWTILIGFSLIWNLHQIREFVMELARNEAELSYEKDLAYRLWAAKHGGVYVPVTPFSPPNPYLARITERDIQTPSGRKLTLVNPAYMTRQVHELSARSYGSQGHLTSLKPLRPENAPDSWEAKALEAFEAGTPELIEVVPLAGQPHLRLMRPWRTEENCLGCHREQGYRVGDIRGGISVAVPMQPYLAGIRVQTFHQAIAHGLIWLLGGIGILLGGRRLQKHMLERRQAEAELADTLRSKEEALALLDAIFDSTPIGLGFWDRDLRFVRLNQALADINGFPIEAHLGRRVDEMVAGLDAPQALLDAWQEILETGEPRLNVELSGTLASNPTEWRIWSDNWFPVRRGNEIIGLAATVTDITERKKAEEEIQRLASFPRLNPNPVLEFDADGKVTYANQAALAAVQQAPGACLQDFLPGDWELIKRATREEGPKIFGREVRIHQAVFGESITFAEPFGVWRLYAIDITERQRAEEALRGSEERLRWALQGTGGGAWDWDLTSGEAWWSQEMYQLWSVKPGTRMQLDNSLALVHQDDRNHLNAAVEAAISQGADLFFEFRIQHPQLGERWMASYGRPRYDQNGRPLRLIGITLDITERKRAEEEMARQKELLQGIIDHIPVMLTIYDPYIKTMRFNEEFRKLLGWTEADMTDADPMALFYPEPAYREQVRQYMESLEPGWRDFQVTTKNGGILHSSWANIRLANDTQIGIGVDIRERKRAEEALQARSAELVRAVADLEDKNTELERFTYMISHDLKSPLVTISAFLGYLEEDMKSGAADRVAKDMHFMRQAAEKMRQLLEELLEMSRVGRVVNPSVEVTFQELVAEALNVVAGSLVGRGLDVLVSQEDLTLFGDRLRLAEIWQNLVENAVKFMGEQPEPRLEIGFEREGKDTVYFVKDNGMGIDPQYQGKVFGIFEKLDAASEGSGIGLALVKRIVELYHGTIWLESAGRGQGACFRFTLPGALPGREQAE